MRIDISVDADGNVFVESDIHKRDEPVTLTDGEGPAVRIIFDLLSEKGIDATTLKLERRSSNYLTIRHEHYDFIRLKIGECSKYISLAFSNKNEWRSFSDNPKVSSSPDYDKNIFHRRLILNDVNELKELADIIYSSYKSMHPDYKVAAEHCTDELTDLEHEAVSLLLGCLTQQGVDTSMITLHIGSGRHIRFIHKFHDFAYLKIGKRVKRLAISPRRNLWLEYMDDARLVSSKDDRDCHYRKSFELSSIKSICDFSDFICQSYKSGVESDPE